MFLQVVQYGLYQFSYFKGLHVRHRGNLLMMSISNKIGFDDFKLVDFVSKVTYMIYNIYTISYAVIYHFLAGTKFT